MQEFSSNQRANRKHGCVGIRYHMHVCGSQVEVRVSMTVGMSMVMVMISQQQGADDVHRQSDHSDHNGLIEQDRDRMEQTLDRFQRHEQRDAAE